MRPIRPRAQAALISLLVAAIVAGCGGGSGGASGGPTTPPPPPRMISWSADAVPGDQTIYLDIRDLSTPDEFVLQVRVSDVTDLYGLAMDIVFPSSRMDFLAAETEEGEFLRVQGAFVTELQISENPAGRIIIGYTRQGDVRGRSGNGLLLLLKFRTTANGSSEFDVENRLAVNGDGDPVSTTWLGGTVQIQR